MSLDRMKADLEAILLVECPPSLRLAVIILWILTAHALGLLWMFAGVYEREAVRIEVHQEVHELREEMKNVWGMVEYLKTGQDKAWLESGSSP